jgi:hypothetical protein
MEAIEGKVGGAETMETEKRNERQEAQGKEEDPPKTLEELQRWSGSKNNQNRKGKTSNGEWIGAKGRVKSCANRLLHRGG